MENLESNSAAAQSFELLRKISLQGKEYEGGWRDFAVKYELPKDMPRHGCGVYQPKIK